MKNPFGIIHPALLIFFSLFGLNGYILSQEIEVPLTLINQQSDIIVHAKAESAASQWVQNQYGRNIVTTTKFRILEQIKGNISGQETFSLESMGGTIGDTTQYVSTSVIFTPGEECILFLQGNPLVIVAGRQGRLPVIDHVVYTANQQIGISQFVGALKESVGHPDTFPAFLRKLQKEPFSAVKEATGKSLKSGKSTTTNTYSVNGYIANFVGVTDRNNDGYFEEFTFDFRVDGTVDPGPENVYVKMNCLTTGESWFSNAYYIITGTQVEFASFTFNQSRFTGSFTGNTDLDFSVELWDESRTTLLASDLIIENEPVKIGEPIPPDVIINSISPDKASAGTGSIITITGTDFGNSQGTGKVEFFYREGYLKIAGQVQSWTDTQIQCTVPAEFVNGYPGSAGSGPVYVTTNSGQKSNGFPFRITFGYGGSRWASETADYYINENLAAVVGEGAAIQAAAQTWNDANSQFSFHYAGASTSAATSINGVNEILWGQLTSSTLAQSSMILASNYIVECDIMFNNGVSWTTTPGSPPSSLDIESTAVHELGHWLNLRDIYGTLDNEYDGSKIMYGFGSYSLSKRDLHEDDIAGITWIYGASTRRFISGYVKTAQSLPVAGVVMNGLPGSPQTDASGYYSADITAGWTGTTVPEKESYTFTPVNKHYTNVTASLTDQNFSAYHLNNDATLSDLKADGITVTGFNRSVHTYTLQLPFGTTVVPTVTATASDLYASAAITPATSLPGITLVRVTAEDGITTQDYTVIFTITAPSADATLNDLKFDGTQVPGFDPGTLSYNIVLAHGSTVIPVVTASTNDADAGYSIVQASTLPGAATVLVTAEDGVTQRTYTVNFLVAKNNDATLAALFSEGTLIDGFEKWTLSYTIEKPYGTTAVPAVTATTSDTNASVQITPAQSMPGNTLVVVTAENGTTSLTYTVHFTLASPANDANLSDLLINGSTIAQFNPSTTYYDIHLTPGTVPVPVVTATTSDVHAFADVIPATSLPGTTHVIVTAQDGITRKTYSIEFILAKNTDASLSNIMVSGIPVPGFVPSVHIYQYSLPYGTVAVPTVNATTNDSKASFVITPAVSVPGSTIIQATAEDGTTTLIYFINFILEKNNDATLSELLVNGNALSDFRPDSLIYDYVVSSGTIEVPTFTAIPADFNATVSLIIAVAIPGTTLIEVTAADGITERSYEVRIRYPLSAIIDIADAHSLLVYPNPNSGFLTVDYESPDMREINISIIDQLGRILREQTENPVHGQVKATIDMTGESAGIYFIRLINGSKVSFVRFVLER